MTATLEVHGSVAAGFDDVARAFEENFDTGLEVGAACAVYVDGHEAVNIWAGLADPATGRAWDDRTLALVYSTTKGVTAICAHVLVERGLLDLDRPVAEYWPEFAAAGKAEVPVRFLLSHQAGLPVVDASLTRDECLAVEPIIRALEAQAPVWAPGTRHGYHGLTFGWLVSEVIRRVTGQTVGEFLAAEVAPRLGGLDFYIGLPEAEFDRVAVEVPPVAVPPSPSAGDATGEAADDARSAVLSGDSLIARALTLNGALLRDTAEPQGADELRRYYGAEFPAVNGIGDARSLARLYASCVSDVDGVRLLSPETAEAASAEHAGGVDAVLMLPTRYGAGFWLPTEVSAMLSPRSFGHPGMGGSIGFADPDARVGFGYVMNQMSGAAMGTDPRKRRLIDAVRACLAR